MDKNYTGLELVHCGNIDILVPTVRGASAAISRPQIRAKYEPQKFARKTSEDIERKINDVWRSKCARNAHLYNASKFRLAGCEVLQDGSLALHLGMTCYKDMCGTNLSEAFPSLQETGERNFGDQQAYMSDPVGVGLLAVTSDDCLVVTRRAQWTGEYPGALDRPGGHPEPNRVFLPDGSLKPTHEDLEEVVAGEVWAAARQEAVDELGVCEADVGELILLGIDRNLEAGGRPSLEFFARLGVSGAQVQAMYRLGAHAEAEESTALHLLCPATVVLLPSLLTPACTGTAPFPQTVCASRCPLLHAYTPPGEAAAAKEEQDVLTEDSHLQEARWLVQGATPALRGALLLALHHHLLPASLPH